MMTDPIADMLTRIRNAVRVRKTELHVPYSRMKFAIAQVLEREGYVGKVVVEGEGVRRQLLIALAYTGQESPIHEVHRISTPGRRVYVGYNDIPRIRSGYGMAILSTPAGILTGRDARTKKVGGELLCEIS